ncbi:hypothetical protein L226DRAFT_539109 [Lentinus tigrinus ALCF2SS1-7]|uniref:uncharacterized protein n=1 Tax=Lentinus tigrinus ALCF2SS1-7 TaxID=1328758 RepID=UPI0011662D29|nr:hypothetical protein L226DRAFT_539109 [Lentinus tigrinus ALCF2SS1-7]
MSHTAARPDHEMRGGKKKTTSRRPNLPGPKRQFIYARPGRTYTHRNSLEQSAYLALQLPLNHVLAANTAP